MNRLALPTCMSTEMFYFRSIYVLTKYILSFFITVGTELCDPCDPNADECSDDYVCNPNTGRCECPTDEVQIGDNCCKFAGHNYN
jgi:hypothetical protein